MIVTAAERLQEVFGLPEHQIDLGRAVLVIAQLERPQLKIDNYLERLAGYARDVEERLDHRYDPRNVIDTINQYLFAELGFCGNRRDYYDPRNSLLNEVMDRQLGIPITLSVLYLEIGRRLGFPFYGVGLPGHFLVKYDDGRREMFVDPFHFGRLLDREGCEDVVRQARGDGPPLTAKDFAAVDNRYIVVRILGNLRGAYLRSRQFRKAVGVLDMITALIPTGTVELKQRGWLHFELHQFSRARADLEAYLERCPDAEDAAEIEGWLTTIRSRQAEMN